MFGIFGNSKLPPLTTACMKLSTPEAFAAAALKLAESIKLPPGMDQRATILYATIMGAAGHLIGRLQWERNADWEGSQHYFRNTNLDVITAEAIIWIDFLMGRFLIHDQGKDPGMQEQIGYTTREAAVQLVLGVMEKYTGFDFKASKYHEERIRYYQEAVKDRSVLWDEPFATIVLRSVGRQSLADPLKQDTGLFPPPEWTPLQINVRIFFSTMPSGFYETFKNMASEWLDREGERIIASQKAHLERYHGSKNEKPEFVLKLSEALAQVSRQPTPDILEITASSFVIPLEYKIIKNISCPKCSGLFLQEIRRGSLNPRKDLDWPYSCPGGDEYRFRCSTCGHSFPVTFWFTK